MKTREVSVCVFSALCALVKDSSKIVEFVKVEDSKVIDGVWNCDFIIRSKDDDGKGRSFSDPVFLSDEELKDFEHMKENWKQYDEIICKEDGEKFYLNEYK